MTAFSRRVYRLIGAVLLLSACVCAQAARNSDAELEQKVQNLLFRMTLEEKLGQLAQFSAGQPQLEAAASRGMLGSALNVTGAAKFNALQRAQLQASPSKIPALFGYDVIHGYRTLFPIPLAIASTWDPDLAELSARIAAKEARADGIRWTFAPMVDVARDPRWGRVAEGSGEDPFLGSAFARAYVRGFQGNDLDSPDSVLACAKHFAGYGAAEAGRDYNTTDISEHRLREVYLPPFKAAVDAGVGTLMSAFNSLNGVPASANRHTLTEILRREWGFQGFVVSDYKSVEELIHHGVAGSPQEAAVKALTAGVDMEMVSETYATLAATVRSGRLSESVVDEAVRRILRLKFRLGLFEHPYAEEPTAQPQPAAARLPPPVPLPEEHLQAARMVARKSIVLLKNSGNLLPLSKRTRSLALIGPLANDKRDMRGPWPAIGRIEDSVTVLQGIRADLGSHARITYFPGTTIHGTSTQGFAAAVRAARAADVTVMVLGEAAEMSGEAASRTELDLPGNQQRLLEAVVGTGKPVVLVVMSGRPLALTWADRHVPAIVQAWFLGTETGHALADVLFGDVNPSGKLPITFPRSVGQAPIYYSYLPTGRPFSATDKFTSKYIDSPNTPLYPFGFGLSYTKFAYTGIAVSHPKMALDGQITVSAEVKNIGTRAGEEIAQLYIGDPVASVSRPVKELRGFQRISLAPGEKKRVEFVISKDALGFWNPENQWTVEPGIFNAWIAPSSVGGLKTSFELVGM